MVPRCICHRFGRLGAHFIVFDAPEMGMQFNGVFMAALRQRQIMPGLETEVVVMRRFLAVCSKTLEAPIGLQ